MKIKIIIAAVISILCTSLKAQEIILGEKKTCPGETYEYSFNGTSCDGNIQWSVNHGIIVEKKKISVKVIWQEGFVGNGAWHVRAHYTPQLIAVLSMDISMSSILSGPNDICSEDTYHFYQPRDSHLKNAAVITTLTAVDNNKWKVR